MQAEVNRKIESADSTDHQLLELQRQFVDYRNDKNSEIKSLNEKIEEL